MTARMCIERRAAHKTKKQSHKQLAVAELDTKFVITSESSSSRIEPVYHGPVDYRKAWYHTISSAMSLLSKKVKMPRMLQLL